MFQCQGLKDYFLKRDISSSCKVLLVGDVVLKDRREGRPEEPGGRGLNKGSNLESISKTFGGRLLLEKYCCTIILTGCCTC